MMLHNIVGCIEAIRFAFFYFAFLLSNVIKYSLIIEVYFIL